jgi:uncharacterized repeat protein (TIGR03803 family)
MRLRAASSALALAIALVPAVAATQPQSHGFKVLYSFTNGADGTHPWAGLVLDAAGNLYGTTQQGGASGYGTVFTLDKTGTETVLYSFTGGTDGANPIAGLVRDTAGNLYGTTEYGGDLTCGDGYGCGTVFVVDKSGNETVLYSFTGTGGDGADPAAGLVRDSQGNLYGTTQAGGASGYGTVFMLDKTGTETVLYSFTGTGGDGAYPYAGLVRDSRGNLYGTTYAGGTSDSGTVFVLGKTGKETVLYSFSGAPDGAYPLYGSLLRDWKGNLYGTTEEGGVYGYGSVFKLARTGKETVLYSFTGSGEDGAYPYAGLVRDAKGNLHGTTYELGGWPRYGTVFKLGTTGTEKVLHHFTGGNDGAHPCAGLILDAKGNLYGTAWGGGIHFSCGYDEGCGTVFELTP